MKLSIVIPAYNVQDHIQRTLKSLLFQNSDEFEILIVNDGSTDNTLKNIEDIKRVNDSRFIKVLTQENGGVSKARNLGLKHAKGEYVLFLDGDDYVSEDFIYEVYRILNSSLPEMIYWKYELVSEGGRSIINLQFSEENQTITGFEVLKKIMLERTTTIWTGSVIYNKNFLNEQNICYTEGCIAGEDSEFIFKSLSKAKDVYFINKTMSYYVQREGSITNTYNIRRFDSIAALHRVSEFFQQQGTKFEDLINVIRYEIICKSYMGTFKLCMEKLMHNEKMNSKEAMKKVNVDLEREYPGLTDSINSMMRSFKSSSYELKLLTTMFKVSPRMYYYFSLLKHSVRVKK